MLLNPQVEFAEPNFLISKDDLSPNDPRFNEQWALRNTGQNGGQYGSDVNVSSAWQTTTGSSTTVIAVIDSGIDFTHPDLANNEWTNPTPSASGDLHGWDYIADSAEIKDEQGHGTAIAGIIAAEGNNSVGVTGVMWRASLMSLRVLDNTGTGDIANAVEAIDYAATHGAQVINLSWGTSGDSLALKDAIQRAMRRNVVVVCSAGNTTQDIDATAYYPASFGLKGLISVAGTDNADQLASWSNWGAANVTVAVPGTNILTPQMGGGYWNVTGTSASAPIVSGIAGLLKTVRPSAHTQAIARAISEGARQTASLLGKVSSGGVVSASGALDKLHGSQNQSPPTPTPGYGSGGTGPGGSFSTTPPAITQGAPAANLPNLDQARNAQPPQPKARAPIHSNLICADCDPQGGGGGGGYYPSGDPNFSTARRRPANETGQQGVDLGSRNFNWSLPLLGLPGRAGLDLGLTLFYNSLVWTKDGSYMKFNADLGSPAPGFRLGLPTLQQRFLNSQAGIYAYLMVTPSGGRVELRQVGSSNIYESQDGSYTQLDVSNPNAPLVRTTDGTQLTFTPVTINSEYRCNQIKDRNGNYLTATFNSTNGHLQTITDTLGRVITFVYDGNSNLSAIRQTWGGVSHDWATFNYGEVLVAPGFGGGLLVNGPNGNYTTVLTQVNLHDGSYYTFNYNASFAQVNRINHYAADAHLLAYTSYNVDSSSGQTECPRFTERRDWAESWNNNNEALTTYSVAGDGSWSQQTTPDGTVYKEFLATTGWQSGLTSQTEVWSGAVKQKWTTLSWTQDDTNLSYQQNPRVTETNIYDAGGNRRRTTIEYTAYSLPSAVREYAADAQTVIRRTASDYRWDTPYTDRRIIGLPSVRYLYEGESSLVSKLEYHYDWANHFTALQPAMQHDPAYSASFTYGRAALVGVRRYHKDAPNDDTQAIWVQFYGYDLAGSTLWAQRNDISHRTYFSYADSFSDGNNSRGTMAYPTTITDPDNYSSTTQYNFDTGVVTRSQDPKGAAVTMSYDSSGRMQQITNQVNNAYKRWVYWSDNMQVLSYETIQDGAGEAYSNTVVDGAGRVRASAAENPGSAGGYSAQLLTYDVMGRVVASTNPTEISGGWVPAGDDAAGWVWTNQAYDWKGRPLLTTKPDGSTSEAVYGGCGCAGGEVTTLRDERGRRRKLTMDVLGRLKQVEELNWDQSVYATTSYTINVRDQITGSNQAGQTRSFAYDGHGRLQSRTTPEQGTTSYSYFADDTTQTVTDARGATTTLAYNNRQLITGITYGVPGGVATTANVSFGYDAAGNRTSMTDGLGSVSYVYNTLSQMTSETRTFTGVGSYTLTYGSYNLSGELTSMTNPWSAQVGYSYDKIGRPTGVTGSGYYGVSSYVNSIAYRAFGMKQMNYANDKTLSLQYDNRLRMTDWSVPNVLGWQYFYTDAGENTGRVMFAKNTASSTNGGARDDSLDRSHDYDHLGRLIVSHTGYEARLHMNRQQPGDSTTYGPYSQAYGYDQLGNMNVRFGWGGWDAGYVNWTPSYTNNRMTTNPATSAAMQYDASGNLTNDGYQSYTYDATGQQAYASGTTLSQSYDGDGLRVKKTENAGTTHYLRSTVLGGQVVAELNGSGTWSGYVYLGGQMLAIQSAGASWVHQDPVTKSQRITNSSGTVTSTIDLDPWGGETASSSNQAFQPHRFTTYERDGNSGDEAMMRRYTGKWHRFDQPDPYDGSYDLTDPQSFNRYAYVQNDPVNFVDPSGLMPCIPGDISPQCDSSGFGGWGGGYGGGNGWGSDQRPGLSDIGARDLERSVAVEITRQSRYLPSNAHYIGGLSWGWTDMSQEPFPSYTYSFTLDRLNTLTIWNGRFGWDGATLFRGVDGYPYQKGGLETDWNTQLAIGGILNGFRAAASGVVSGVLRTGAGELNTFATGQLEAHFQKHAAEFGYKSAAQYLRGAQKLIRGGPGVVSFVRGNGDSLFYRAATNEFGVLSRQGVIRTYFKPVEGAQYWLRQVGGPGR